MLKNFLIGTIAFIKVNKIVALIVALLLCVAVCVTAITVSNSKTKGDEGSTVFSSSEEQSSFEEISSEDTSSADESSEIQSSSEAQSSSQATVSSKSSTSNPPATVTPNSSANTSFKYNTNTNVNNNVFLDSLIYTGYNIEKHRSDGLMWVYILAAEKRAKGWLSGIYYGGACSGYETNSAGLPDIALFKSKKHSLVCASYVTYVYFNYLPNVAGIDTSSLARPDDPRLANSWYNAAKKWVANGQASYIDFRLGADRGITSDIIFDADIPIGSIMCFQDYYNRNGYCTHVAVYAGKAGSQGYHWVFHVGNDNGPEFCAVERMNRKPDPQWPLAVISTPTSIRFSASLEVDLKDDNGDAISGVDFTLKSSNGNTISLGKTDASGKLVYNGLVNGDYTLVHTAPQGYTSDSLQTQISLTTKNNSYNKVNVVDKKSSGDSSGDTTGGE